MRKTSGFLGTYFERDAVLRLERFANIIAWLVLATYAFEAAYNVFQSSYGAITSGYPLDWFYVFITLSRVALGGVFFVMLQVAAKVMLILLDIEDNTRRASRVNLKEI